MYLKEIVDYMAKPLVDDTDSAEMQEIRGEQSDVIELRVSEAGIGQVIGQKGQNAAAIRTILSAVAARSRKRGFLDVIGELIPPID